VCHMAVSLKFMVVLQETGITERIGFTEHVNRSLCKFYFFTLMIFFFQYQ